MVFLGIDIGTGGSRAVLIDKTGTVLCSATAEHAPFASPEIGWAEQDPDDWWRAASEAIGKICLENPANAKRIAAVGLSGQMHGAVLLDDSGNVIRPAIIWCDQRTEKQGRKLTSEFGKDTLIELVSNPALPNMTLTKLLWVREHERDNWNNVAKVMLPKDYVRFRMTGKVATDVSDASGTLMLDVSKRKWSAEVISRLGINHELLPAVYESHELTGEVTENCAAETGLEAGIPVVAGAGDNAAGAIGMGTVGPGQTSVTIGTSGVAFTVIDKPKIDLKGRIHTFCHAIPDRWHLTGVTQAAGYSLKWFRDNFGAGKDYVELVSEAEEIEPGADGLIWTPYLMGERTPHVDPNARASLIGLTASHTNAHVVRAILEGVAFSLKDCLEVFRELDLPIGRIRLGGGGAKSDLWRKIQADIYGQTVETIAAEEGAAFGAALLAGVGAGAWSSIDDASEKTIRVNRTIEPVRSTAETYASIFETYKRVYPSQIAS
ncbi:MAG: xylulokinase [Pyrinomonadaceae bacterium]|nr:xylulokinase [Pyrinomonadaceae bacterium]